MRMKGVENEVICLMEEGEKGILQQSLMKSAEFQSIKWEQWVRS